MSEQTPAYAADPAYQALARICEEAGVRVRYADLPPVMYARSRGDLIQMPLDAGRFTGAEHAAIVLGHELAHMLVNPAYPQPPEDRTDLPRHMLIESDCDRLGAYLYLLARKTAEHALPVPMPPAPAER